MRKKNTDTALMVNRKSKMDRHIRHTKEMSLTIRYYVENRDKWRVMCCWKGVNKTAEDKSKAKTKSY